MQTKFIVWGRRLWVLLAINGIITLALSLWVAVQLLQNPSQRIVQGLAETGLALDAYRWFFLITTVIVFLVFFIVALLIFLRRRHEGFALFVAIFLLGYGAANAYPQFAEFTEFYLHPPLWYWVPTIISSLFSWPLLVIFLCVYPDGKFVPRWTLYFGVLGTMLTTTWLFFPTVFLDFQSPIGIFGAVGVLSFTVGSFSAQIWRYRHHLGTVQRQQSKWFLYALAFFVLVSILSQGLPVILTPNPSPTPTQTIWGDILSTLFGLTFIVLPIAVCIAILRYRLWDIDVIIRKTLTYALVAAFLAAFYFGSVILLQQVFASVTGQRNQVITVVSTLAIAALFVPLRNRIQATVDRRFYRKKYDAQQVLGDFAGTVRDETDLERLTGRLMQVVNETMQPKSVSVWLAKENSSDLRNAGR